MKSNYLSLYFHIPFCEQKCNYCDFYSFAGQEEQIDVYLDNLENELKVKKLFFNSIRAKTIYIGGGTPSILSVKQLDRLFMMIHKYIDISEPATSDEFEFTVEANPNSINEVKLEIMKAAGVNRISLGAQSFDEDELRILGRIHTKKDIIKAINAIEKNNIYNYNIDLMYGIPGQNKSSWEKTINEIIAIKPKHLSTYNLIVEENTPFYYQEQTGKLELPDEADVVSMYKFAINRLLDAGYLHYEISNFCQENYHSRHNLTYWDNNEYLAFGLGSWSYIGNCRFSNHYSFEKYAKQYKLNSLGQNNNDKSELFRLQAEVIEHSQKDDMENFIMLSLRKKEGIDKANFEERYNQNFDLLYNKQVEKLMKQGLLIQTEKSYKLSLQGILFSNDVINKFLD